MSVGRTIAVMDVGSNSVRLLVVRELSPVAFEVIDEERFDARLGQGQVGDTLAPAALERGAEAMRLVSQVARSYGPATTVVVGTEALRRASNAPAFIADVERQTGLHVRLLSAFEEAYASFLGVINSTGLRDGWIVDIGGGSLEFMRVQGRGLAASTSVPLGAIYAAEQYLRTDPPTHKEVRSLRRAVRQGLDSPSPPPSETLYGVGGAIRNLARIIRQRKKYPLRRLHGLTIERPDLQRLVRTLASATADERRAMPGIGPARADTLHAAAIVVDEVMELSGARRLWVTGQGLREGLVWQELRGDAAVLPDVRAASISGLARANGVDDLAAEPVVSAAAQLFEATRGLHGLDSSDRDLLLDAARLAGIGMHIDYYNRDRHAEYLVHSGDLHGFTHREIVLLAELVRCADSGSPDFGSYAALVRAEDSRRVSTLAAMLGAARAVRRRRPSPVLAVETAVVRDQLHITLRGRGALDAELISLGRQQKRLAAALKVSVEVSVAE